MSTLDDILNNVSPVMGQYRVDAVEEVARLRALVALVLTPDGKDGPVMETITALEKWLCSERDEAKYNMEMGIIKGRRKDPAYEKGRMECAIEALNILTAARAVIGEARNVNM